MTLASHRRRGHLGPGTRRTTRPTGGRPTHLDQRNQQGRSAAAISPAVSVDQGKVRRRGGSDAAEDEGALDLLDRLRDLDPARAGVRAVEGGPAAPDALALVEDLQPILAGVITAVED